MFLIELNVLTLNIWGIPFVSSDRETRISAISTELSTGKYDVVSLQEVWSQSDCQALIEQTVAILPFSHYFFSGVIGSGLLVLSKYPIIGTLFHAWSVNGYFHRIQHADWFGGKGVGLCRILIDNHVIHIYNAHLHAEYDNENDEYKTHRVIQAFDTAQFIKATRGNSVVQILAGDLNTKPQDISYKILLYTSKMRDSCQSDTITTNECQRNSYTSKSALLKNPNGIRIDHIFVRCANKFEASVEDYFLPFPDRVPGHKFSFSDHEAVLTKLKITSSKNYISNEFLYCSADGASDIETKCLNGNHKDDANPKSHCIGNGDWIYANRVTILNESIALCDSSLEQLKMDRIFYYSIAIFITILLITLAEYSVPNGFKTIYLLLKFILFGGILFCIFMGSIWNFMERNGILSGKMAMETMLKNIEKYKLSPINYNTNVNDSPHINDDGTYMDE